MTLAYAFAEFAHLRQNPINFWHDIFAINQYRLAAAVAEGGVEDCALFSEIDFFTCKHTLTPAFNLALTRKFGEQAHGFFIDTLLGVIKQKVIEL